MRARPATQDSSERGVPASTVGIYAVWHADYQDRSSLPLSTGTRRLTIGREGNHEELCAFCPVTT